MGHCIRIVFVIDSSCKVASVKLMVSYKSISQVTSLAFFIWGMNSSLFLLFPSFYYYPFSPNYELGANGKKTQQGSTWAEHYDNSGLFKAESP